MYPFTEIITVVHDQLNYTEACLNSLYRNTPPDSFRLIVVDSGSGEETKNFLKNLKAKVSNMELLINDENVGWCKGLNQGFKLLKQDSDFVLWANNDILFEADWLEKMIKHFRGAVGAVGPTSNYVYGRQQIIYNHGHYEEITPELIGFCLMFRREVINIVGDVDERFGLGGSEEWDYQIRMKRDCGFISMIARDIYIHHFGSKTLWGKVGDGPDGYDQYVKEKDKILREKWGDATVDSFLTWPRKNLLLAIPHPGVIKGKFWKDERLCWKPEMTELLEIVGTSAIHDARNEAVKYALKGDYKYLMFMDSDMRIPSDTIFKLLDHRVPIVSGLFYARTYPHFPCVSKLVKDEKGEPAAVAMHEPNTGFKEYDLVGMACTLIETRVFKDLQEDKKKKGLNPHEFFYWGQFGEDYQFCYDVRQLGFKIFCDTDLIIRHIGEEREIGPEDWKGNVKEEKS